MINLIKSEMIKGRRSFGRKALLYFPLLVTLMAVALMGGQLTQVGAYNWWYMMFLPICVALTCINLTAPEKQLHFYNIAVLPITKAKVWGSKVATGCLYLLVSNLFVFGFTTLSGFLFGAQYPLLRGIAAALVLTLTWAWQIPFGMFLSTRFNSAVTFLGILGLNIICSFQDIAGGKLWYIPFAIPARLMAPILGINPNGVPMSPQSPLHDFSVVLPGLIITIMLFVITVLLTNAWFNGRSE